MLFIYILFYYYLVLIFQTLDLHNENVAKIIKRTLDLSLGPTELSIILDDKCKRGLFVKSLYCIFYIESETGLHLDICHLCNY